MLLFLVVSFCFLAEGLPLTEENETSEILKRLEAKLEMQDAVNEAVRRDMSELFERMESKANRTEEALKAIKDTGLNAFGDRAVRDLPFIMMCAYRNHRNHRNHVGSGSTGIISYNELTLDFTNCDRPGGGCSSMDISSGTFTALTGGLYTVTFSGQAYLYEFSMLKIYLLHNGSRLKESYSYSFCGSGCGGIEEMLSRTVVS